MSPIVDRFNVDPNALYIARLESNGKERHSIVYLNPVNDGGMYEYIDPVSALVVGCCGCNRLGEFTTALDPDVSNALKAAMLDKTPVSEEFYLEVCTHDSGNLAGTTVGQLEIPEGMAAIDIGRKVLRIIHERKGQVKT